ncbi:hypothetical protein RND81_05G141900 [Saponaria officinalis]|uniref:PROP1-like PPR domain-containing protein n=1 Tax=Saponaria officinalis TaxID=3572 RepID=A0AAW1KSM6_SAPOF
MACSSTRMLSYPFLNKLPKPSKFLNKPTKHSSLKPQFTSNSTQITNPQITQNVQIIEEQNKERPKFKWVEIKQQNMTESQKVAILKLPKTMEKRCKALMRQIICYAEEKGSLCDLLGVWVKLMKPTRCDWLSVLKELCFLDHPFFFQISELALLEESFEGNIRDYTKLIHMYAKNGRVEDAENVLLAMTNRGMTCDQVTLTTVIHMYSKAGHFKLAEETFEEMKLHCLPLDRRSYGSMIMAYIRADMPNKGEDLFKEMERHEMYAGKEVYKALLRAYSMKGDVEGAQRVFDALQVAGICPDFKLFGLLINAYHLAGQSQKARVVFDNMRKAGIEPHDKCVALLLATYEKENRLNTALDLLVSLERDGILVGKEASQVLVEWFRRLGVVDDVAHVLKECVANVNAL